METLPLTESKTIRDDLNDSIVMLNHYTSVIINALKTKQFPDDFFSEWYVYFMKVHNYTSHEENLSELSMQVLKYLEDKPRQNLEEGLKLSKLYIKAMFTNGIVHYRG